MIHNERVGEAARDGIHASAHRFTHHEDVRANVFPVDGEHLAGTTKAGLDLVCDHQHVILLAEGLHALEVALMRNDYATLALNWFNHDSTSVGKFD